MSEHWCSVCHEDAEIDDRASGCGDPSCCFPVYTLPCGCDGSFVEHGDKPDESES